MWKITDIPVSPKKSKDTSDTVTGWNIRGYKNERNNAPMMPVLSRKSACLAMTS